MEPNKNENQQPHTIHLNLEETTTTDDHPRHLTIHSNHILAIGGLDGIITSIPLHDTTQTSREIKRYDEAVKALAFSEDGQRVAVGYEDGFVDVYVYSKENLEESETHPFLEKRDKEEDFTNSTDFLTQSSQFSEGGDVSGPTFRVPHRFEASIRHLQFQPHPTTNTSRDYYLAIAAESSPGLRIVNVAKEETASTSYFDEEATSCYKKGGVRSVSFSPDGNHLMTLGMDGKTCIWTTKFNGDPQLDWELMYEDTLPIVDQKDMGAFANVADKCLYPIWNENGTIVAIPGCVELKFRKGGNGKEEEWLKENRMVLNMGAKKEEDGNRIVGLAIDPKDEGYVIVSTRDGGVGLWKIDHDREEHDPEGAFIAQIHKNASMCTHILWHKDKNTNHESLHLALQNGTMVTFSGRDNIIREEVVSSYEKTISQRKEQSKEDVSEDPLMDNDDKDGEEISPSTNKKKRRLQKKSQTMDEGNLDDDDELSMFDDSGDAEIESVGQPNHFVADEAEENLPQNNDDADDVSLDQFDDVIPSQNDADLVPVVTTTTTTETNPESTKEVEMNHDNDDFNRDAFEVDDYVDNADDEHDMNNMTTMMDMTVKPQLPFAPSSTPLAERTILCWNHIGVITSRDDDQFKSIDISFTDAMSNRPVSFTDNMHFELGSLGEDGAIFATDLVNEVDDDDDIADVGGLTGLSERTRDIVRKSRKRGQGDRATGSCVYFHRFESFGTMKNKDWFITLPEGEKVLGCTAGAGWNAVVTSRRFLRTFTSGGVQGPIVWLRGDPVTMVGRGRFLAVFYHEGNPLMNKTQKLGYSLYDGITMREIACDSVAGLSSESSLSWAGFSNDFALSIMDDDGMLSMLMTMKPDEESNDPSSFSWAPMLDTVGLRKSREDSFWPVTVQNGKLICVPLKGIDYPNPARRPMTTSFQLRIPLARDGNDKGINGMEEVAVRANMALEHKNFMNHFESNYGSADAEKLEHQYDEICAQVDKITLKLLFKKIEGAKLEAALDLVHRLHLEKSFEIAMDVADRSRHRKLSDKIYAIMEEKFNSKEDDDDGSIDDESYNGSITAFARNQDFDKRGINVSPEAAEDSNQNRNPKDVQVEERPKSRKRINPFATNTKKSPGKSLTKSPATKKPMLSRLSSFSSESRQVNKASKEIL